MALEFNGGSSAGYDAAAAAVDNTWLENNAVQLAGNNYCHAGTGRIGDAEHYGGVSTENNLGACIAYGHSIG